MNAKANKAKNEITIHGVMATTVIATLGFENDLIVDFKNFHIIFLSIILIVTICHLLFREINFQMIEKFDEIRRTAFFHAWHGLELLTEESSWVSLRK